MTDDEFKIHEEAPTDGEGHPIHPERGHRICAATKSDRTTPTEHGRERDEFDYCLLAAGWGTDGSIGACRKHPYDGSQIGKSNPNYRHGAYSEFQELQQEQLSDQEKRMLDAIDFDENAQDFAKDVVKEAYIKGHRSGDERFFREARQWASEFGVIEAAPEKHEVDGTVEVDQQTEIGLDEDTKEILDDLTGGT